jgi:hypothetical protein
MTVPVGWFMAGKAPDDYEATTDKTAKHSGTQCARVGSKVAKPSDFGTLMQLISAETYRGQRLRLSGWVKTADVVDWCGLWMRVDGGHGRYLAFDNMRKRAIQGTTPWTRYEVVLDVAQEAEGIFFGIVIEGAGTAWLDDVTLEPVGLDVPTTSPPMPRAPRNLAFEE